MLIQVVESVRRLCKKIRKIRLFQCRADSPGDSWIRAGHRLGAGWILSIEPDRFPRIYRKCCVCGRWYRIVLREPADRPAPAILFDTTAHRHSIFDKSEGIDPVRSTISSRLRAYGRHESTNRPENQLDTGKVESSGFFCRAYGHFPPPESA